MKMPQKTIGILGSGQLGRMLVIAASQLGLRTHVYAPDAENSPAGDIAHDRTEAAYDDHAALARFASSIDAVTSEFENVPASTMATLAKTCLASPGEAALHTAQPEQPSAPHPSRLDWPGRCAPAGGRGRTRRCQTACRSAGPGPTICTRNLHHRL
jgi:D-arabinose 1-dehydrogenase-like Zn-dependent alcohol dehydrogenase